MAIGERLREARLRQKVDIAEVEAETKIRAKYLRALENEDFDLLPGATFVKTFLRTYGEYLGLDAQLLVEEYRAEHEPRGEAELQPFAPAARQRARERPRRAPSGPPGPGTALLVVVAVVLVIFAILGLTGGSGNKNQVVEAPKKPATKKKAGPKHAKPKPAVPTRVRLVVIPAAATYLCVDRGAGTPIVYQGISSAKRVFKGRRLRLNAGGTSIRITANKKRVRVGAAGQPFGFEFTPRRTRPIPNGQRPCQGGAGTGTGAGATGTGAGAGAGTGTG